MYAYIPITNTICKQLGTYITSIPFPRGFGGGGGSWYIQRHSWSVFQLCWTKWLPQNFDLTVLRKKALLGAYLPSNLIGRLKQALALLISIQMILSKYFRTAESIWLRLGKANKKNKNEVNTHPWWQKKKRFQIFRDRSLTPLP